MTLPERLRLKKRRVHSNISSHIACTIASVSIYSVDKLITEARKLAIEFRRTTGKPLPGISAEIADYDAARYLDLEICKDKSSSYDAIGKGARDGLRIQIKGRTIFDEGKTGQRVGQLKIEQEWDRVVLVLIDDSYEAFEIYEAERQDILDAMDSKDSSSRKKRGAMSVAQFKIISELVWTREDRELSDGLRDNQSGS